MTLQQLRYFVRACYYGNISRAAEEFSVSQPSVSSAIKALENEFGVYLIKRRQSGFVLTEEGEELRALAVALLDQADSVENAMHARGNKRQFLRLGVPPMVASALFPRIYCEFTSQCGDVTLYTREMGRDDLLKALDEKLLDMAFLPHTEPFGPEFQTVAVKSFETVCCVSEEHPLAKKKLVTPEDLAEQPLVLFSEGFLQTERILTAFMERGLETKVIHTTSQVSTVEQFVSEGIAVGFLFREIAEANGKIVSIPFSPKLETNISLVMKRGLLLSDGMERFFSCVEAFAQRGMHT